MKTVQDVITQFNSTVTSKRERLDTLIKTETRNIEMLASKLAELERKLPLIIEGLNRQGLILWDISYYKTGWGDDWNEGDSLSVSINAVPAEKSKFKFITFNGYTPKGSGKNDKRLREKAAILKRQMEEVVGGITFECNHFSLEVKNHGEEKMVMYSTWI